MPYGFYLSGSRVTLRDGFRTIKFQLTFYKIIIMSSLLYSPTHKKALRLKNRIAISPMCQYSAVDGFAMIGI
jgi:hypothetical protein